MISSDKLNTLVIFRSLLKDRVFKYFQALLESISDGSCERISRYANFASELFGQTQNFTDYLLERILCDDNFYIDGISRGMVFNSSVEECLQYELRLLQEISQIDAESIKCNIENSDFLPVWETRDVDFAREYNMRIKNIDLYGYGIYSTHHMFTLDEKGMILPVERPDNIEISNLKGYDSERKSIIDNTLSLLRGGPAANVLLYGDAGTGKSSTVKAIANRFKDEGLRLIEIKKDQLHLLPVVMNKIHMNCLKFILYIDDLSFTKNSDDFGALKAVLEGTVVSKPDNAVIYVTSNRRHLIKETFSDRDGDDIHVNETIQEMSSLSERFGVMVYFGKPNKQQYIDIVHALAEEFNLKKDREGLTAYAESYALVRGGRSPRIARQLIEHLMASQ